MGVLIKSVHFESPAESAGLKRETFCLQSGDKLLKNLTATLMPIKQESRLNFTYSEEGK